ATLDGWQQDDPGGAAPDWQITGVSGDVTGTAAVDSGDDGTDTEAVGPDSETEHFVDTGSGTDAFQYHASGDGTTFTLGQTATVNLTTHSDDDVAARWRDPATVDGESGTDAGSEEIDDVEDTTATVVVAAQRAIDADGHATLTGSQVDVTAGGTAHLTDDGSDDQAAPGVDE